MLLKPMLAFKLIDTIIFLEVINEIILLVRIARRPSRR